MANQAFWTHYFNHAKKSIFPLLKNDNGCSMMLQLPTHCYVTFASIENDDLQSFLVYFLYMYYVSSIKMIRATGCMHFPRFFLLNHICVHRKNEKSRVTHSNYIYFSFISPDKYGVIIPFSLLYNNCNNGFSYIFFNCLSRNKKRFMSNDTWWIFNGIFLKKTHDLNLKLCWLYSLSISLKMIINAGGTSPLQILWWVW